MNPDKLYELLEKILYCLGDAKDAIDNLGGDASELNYDLNQAEEVFSEIFKENS